MRLLRTPPNSAAYNLALDEALLRSGTPTLRLYSWEPPGYSLGFFQRAAEHTVPDGFVAVRRPTGGGAIAHKGELTISWVGAKRRVDDVYSEMNRIVMQALRDGFGVEVHKGVNTPEAAPAGLCFDAHTCYDLCADGGKVFGSAQRRAHETFLLHGSLVLEPNPWSEGAISLSELVGRSVTREETEQAVIAASSMDLEPGALTEKEQAETERLVREKYANPTWLNRR